MAPNLEEACVEHAAPAEMATRARNDIELVKSWLDSLGSPQTQRNFKATAERLLDALQPLGLRQATVEDVRAAADKITAGKSTATERQYKLRIKSLLSYGHELGYLMFNAGVRLKAPKDTSDRAKRVVGDMAVRDMLRAAQSDRDRVAMAVLYGAAVRVSELVALDWGDVTVRDNGQVRLSVLGKGDKRRPILIDAKLGAMLLALRSDASDADPVFRNYRGGRLSTRSVEHIVEVAALRAGIKQRATPHWLRHSHASHALERGKASLALVRDSLGHASISTTNVYIESDPDDSSGLHLNPEVFEI